jgi:hypothetical protein
VGRWSERPLEALTPTATIDSEPAYRRGSQDLRTIMSTEPTADRWRAMAGEALQRVTAAEDRFSASIALNKTTMLAAADEMQAATTDAAAWLHAHPCPDPILGRHVALLLDACAEVVQTAQLSATEPWAESKLAMVRLGRLLGLIDLHARAVNDWHQ